MPVSRKTFLIAVVLTAFTIILYWPARDYSFINFDDPLYVTENPRVLKGLTWDNLFWAFGQIHGEDTYWHPLTWLSLMLDCQLWGANPHAAHVTNFLFHSANVLLIFLLLRRLTTNLWASAVVAALFAWHPLQVDTVAWISERKNLLSAFFALLSLLAYHYHVTAPSWRRYGLALFFFALALLAKPSVVVLPVLMLLLDLWPLARFQPLQDTRPRLTARRFCSLLVEKWPFIVLAFLSSAITIIAHKELHSLSSSAGFPPTLRLCNGLVSYGTYLKQFLWPAHLAVHYPYPASIRLWKVAAAGAILLIGSIVAVRSIHKRPYFFVGWFWFLAALLPAIGIVQAGSQAMADRFMYLPLIGLAMAVAWGAGEFGRTNRARMVLVAVFLSALAACFAASRIQLSHWQNSLVLFSHALDVTSRNALAHLNYGVALTEAGRSAEAVDHFREALRIDPLYAEVHYNLGVIAARAGKSGEAAEHYLEAIRLKPSYARAHFNLGNVYFRAGDFEQAARGYQSFLRLRPDDPEAHNNLGNALAQLGKMDEAISEFVRALQLHPAYIDAHFNLAAAALRKADDSMAASHLTEVLRLDPGHYQASYQLALILARQGRYDEAIRQLRGTVKIKADMAGALNLLARLLATVADARLRNGSEAVAFAEKACALTGAGNPFYLDTLAAAYAESGRFPEALKVAQHALTLATGPAKSQLAGEIKRRIELYTSSRPYHEHP